MAIKPNLSVNMVATQNERGIKGYTNQAQNQIKVNSTYEPVTSLTGQTTLLLVNRPGVSDIGEFLQGSNRLICVAPTVSGALPLFNWVFNVTTTNLNIADGFSAGVVAIGAGSYVPVYVDKTALSGAETVVVQVRNSNDAQRVLFGSTLGGFARITDADFTGLAHVGKMEFMDGFGFVLTSNDRIYNSELNSLANWTAGEFITKQIQQDMSHGLGRFGKQIIAWGRETMEVFQNAGNAGSPLEAVPSLFKRYGIVQPSGVALAFTDDTIASHYYANVEDRIYFPGRIAANGPISVFSYDGERVEKVSTPFIDKVISERGIHSVWPFVCVGQKALAVLLTDVDSATPEWYMFFPEYKEWFRWTSTKFCPVNAGAAFLGANNNSHGFAFDPDTETYFDDSTTVTMEHQFQPPKQGSHPMFIHEYGVDGDTTATTTANLGVAISRDGGLNYETARNIDMTAPVKMLTRGGMVRSNPYVKLTWANNKQVRLSTFLARVE